MITKKLLHCGFSVLAAATALYSVATNVQAAAPSTSSLQAGSGRGKEPASAEASPFAKASGDKTAGKPNILFILVDNLGYGEIGSYGGGVTRGAPTPRIDSLAKDGARFLNMNMETQCTPSRSSLMTGRFSIRSGTYAVPLGGVPEGLTQWEVTIAEPLSAAGYATALHGKWHLGSHDGRLPNDQGFDEWYGIPRTTDESRWSSSPGWSPDIVPRKKIMQGKKGEKSVALNDYDIVQRRLIDVEITKRPVAFMERQAKAGKPFFIYASLTQPHLPTEPNPAFKGRTGNGNWADMLAEMDSNVGQMLDAVDRLGIAENTIVIFTSDNGTDPREEKPTADTWVVTPMLRIVGAFNATTKDAPLIPMGEPDPYVPRK